MTVQHVSEPREETAHDRLRRLAAAWAVAVGEVRETPGSLVAYGRRGDEPVVLKIVRTQGDEWMSGEVLAAFGGRSMVRVLEHVDGAMLLERLARGDSLVPIVLAGRDDEATEILAGVVAAMSAGPTDAPAHVPTTEDWGRGFAWYAEHGGSALTADLAGAAAETYADLCASQRNRRLLHGDLQHSNVLVDEARGWLAIDPKGVIGEPEYELGALLRNPREAPETYTPRRHRTPRAISGRSAGSRRHAHPVVGVRAGRALRHLVTAGRRPAGRRGPHAHARRVDPERGRRVVTKSSSPFRWELVFRRRALSPAGFYICTRLITFGLFSECRS